MIEIWIIMIMCVMSFVVRAARCVVFFIRVVPKTWNPSLFLSSSFSHFLPISSNFTSLNTLFRKIFCVFPSCTSCSNQSRFTTTAINITQLPLTLWIIMMTAIVVHFTDGNRYTSIDCCCPYSLDASELRMQDYFILSSMDDNSCAILLTFDSDDEDHPYDNRLS